MTLDIQRPDLTIAIVGCGVMGQGIAQIAAQAGCRVLMFDTRPGAADAAKAALGDVLAKLVDRGKLKQDQADTARGRLMPVAELTKLADAHVLIEAIVEALDAKRALIGEL
jgi:3-hydroxybutyryl-CoA dehydrogenase